MRILCANDTVFSQLRANELATNQQFSFDDKLEQRVRDSDVYLLHAATINVINANKWHSTVV